MLPRLSRCFSSSPSIHPTAFLHPNAVVHPSARIGPFCAVGQDVEIQQNVHLKSHVVVSGRTTIGARTKVFSHAVIGTESQDKKESGRRTATHIGSDCTIREFVSVNRGTTHSTTIGSSVHLLANVHVGHDCTIEDNVVISNGTCLAGHVSVGWGAIIGGLCGIKQRVRIGQLAMVGGASAVDFDVIPYGLVVGNRAVLRGINLVGLKRNKTCRKEIQVLLSSQRYLYGVTRSATSFAPALNLPDHACFQHRQKELHDAMESGKYGNVRLCRDMLNFLM